MPILNYTTSISCEKTSGEIQKCLAQAGATAVMSTYDQKGVMNGMGFRIGVFSFLLPIKIKGIHNLLIRNNKIPKKLKSEEQAARIAWRIIKDWIEAQVAIIESGQAELLEVFLPYAQNQEGKTLFESLKTSDFKMLNKLEG